MTQKITEFLTTAKNSVIFCVLGGTSVLSNFFCWGTPLPYLELFWVKPFEEEKTPCMRKLVTTVFSFETFNKTGSRTFLKYLFRIVYSIFPVSHWRNRPSLLVESSQEAHLITLPCRGFGNRNYCLNSKIFNGLLSFFLSMT